ncbi:MAG: hypothetical protein HZC36_15585 [Armatimonadetes bacterium]|nr:hypothetical protein [Armatimonadota bacterium]
MYLEACHSGYTNNFIRFCIPYLNAYGKWLEDQAVMAYNTDVYLSEYGAKALVLFTKLVLDSSTVYMARQALVSEGTFHAGPDYHPLATDDLAIYGDSYARLSGVYSKTHEITPGWFRLSWPPL